MIYNGEQTIYNIRLQNYINFNLDFEPLVNTTLNEKFNILPRYKFNDGKKRYPTMNTLVIGIDKHNPLYANNKLKLKRGQHRPTDAALFNHVPFYLRPLNEVYLYPPNIERYRLRTILTIDGVDHLCFWGYFTDNFYYKNDIVKFRNVERDYVDIQRYKTSNPDILNPKPLEEPDFTKKSTNTYLAHLVKIYTFFSDNELKEINNAIDILYPNYENKLITEVGVCSSLQIQLKDKEGKFYNESIWCQMAYFIDTTFDVVKSLEKDKFLDFYIEIGGMEILEE